MALATDSVRNKLLLLVVGEEGRVAIITASFICLDRLEVGNVTFIAALLELVPTLSLFEQD